jgi:hypothetical protein
MSWLYGYLHKGAPKESPLLLTAQKTLLEKHLPALDLFAGGRVDTLNWHELADGTFLIILGRPVCCERACCRYPSFEDWQNWIASDQSKLQNLDGHYALLLYDGRRLQFFNDPLGKRTIYFRESEKHIFFCSDLSLLKNYKATEIDYYKLGAIWHAMYPPTQGGYAPLVESYYQDVQSLGTGSNAVIHLQNPMLTIKNRLFLPEPQAIDSMQLLESYCLLPARQGKRIGIGLSGGMDIRPLLAIYLKAGIPLTIYNYGNKDNYDYQIAEAIARRFSLPFVHIKYSDTMGDWDQVLAFCKDRGVVFNPLHSANLAYYPIVRQQTDAYVSGYFGEVFRFRMMAANLKSALSTKTLDYHDIGAYLFREPPSFFIPEVRRIMHKGFWESLRTAVGQMPSPLEMLNPYWMHLFVIRYWFRTLQAVNYPSIDQSVINILPWIQPSMFSQHWQLGFLNQLNEGLHRKIIRSRFPALEEFPLSATDVAAPYGTRQLALKLKSWMHYKKHPRLREQRTHDFLIRHKDRILELVNSPIVNSDTALDRKKVLGIVEGFYHQDTNQQDAMVCLLAYCLGK